ncbi:MAG: OmpA family protein [Silicimonas sp.]|nr:OmpA family protein [Silicimonas sp.]
MRWLAIFLMLASPAMAVDLTVPGGIVLRSEETSAGQIRLPDNVWTPDRPANVASGAIERTVIRVPSAARTTVQLLSGLRETLNAEGFDEVFSCADAGCGGFDFRFQLDILGEPDMHVDLGDFLYVLLTHPDDGTSPHTVALLASRSRAAGFVHVTQISQAGAVEPDLPATAEVRPEPDTPAATIPSLVETGHAVLSGLDFGSGSADLGDGAYPELEDLAAWLDENPTARIVLVGHTDSVGSLEANTALSRQRAASVARFLTDVLGADGGQIQSSGAGFLAPIASNLTDDGRARNRRVEVVLLSLGE